MAKYLLRDVGREVYFKWCGALVGHVRGGADEFPVGERCVCTEETNDGIERGVSVRENRATVVKPG
ncbi:hypothetical protein [Frondihabitans sp. VKM Ac-2883]|uniref:hypothetical protein n=1 Tax=Frondihabitans sp. VKM Ac-2883 TaxID=2783823 RepID=UPI00188BD679|nr:hypothetical protein [Frondihabitans sp. VKM Ac-2883]MBF4575056.1 hypothetical protein [Frondihabitans sp. VKM Ac-2883]